MDTKPYRHAIIGGTLDAFHKGHQAYVDIAYGLAERVTIRLNHESFVQPMKSYQVRPVAVRLEAVRAYVSQCGLEQATQFVISYSHDDIAHIFQEDTIDLAVVAPDRLEPVQRYNQSRAKKYSIHILPRYTDEHGNDVSSTAHNLGT